MGKIYFKLMIMIVLFISIHPVERAAAAEEEIAYTDYHISLEEAVDIQVNAGATPITDKYKNDPAYIHIHDVHILHPKIAVPIANIRTAPTTDSEVAFQFPKMAPIQIIGVEQGAELEESAFWYKIAYQTNTYYVHTSVVNAWQMETNKDTKIYQERQRSEHAYGELARGEAVTIIQPGEEWFEVKYTYWRTPKPEDVKVQLNPDGKSENMFQHIRLDETIDVSAEELNKVLEGKGILEEEGEAFIAGAKEHGINEAYLIAHALLESGNGTSALATGVEVGVNDNDEPIIVTETNREDVKNIEITYNMFGIGAADSCPLECGAKTAYENGWFTPEKAIQDGAEWIGEGYIYNEFEQNTLYKMKWNPKMGEGQQWKQYATDIGWAEKQTTRIQEIYEQLTDPTYYYDIPMYAEK